MHNYLCKLSHKIILSKRDIVWGFSITKTAPTKLCYHIPKDYPLIFHNFPPLFRTPQICIYGDCLLGFPLSTPSCFPHALSFNLWLSNAVSLAHHYSPRGRGSSRSGRCRTPAKKQKKTTKKSFLLPHSPQMNLLLFACDGRLLSIIFQQIVAQLSH